MTRRSASCGSGFCTGIFLVLVCTSLVKSQTTVSLELPSQITTSGNSTNLHKVSQEGNAPLSALNDGERKLPFQSSTTQVTILPSEWFKNSSSTFNNKEKHLPSNQAPLETTTTVERVPGVQHIEDIDLKKSVKDEQPRKHLMEQLIANSRSQVQDDKPAISEFNDNDEYGDIEDNEKFGNREPTTPKSRKDPGTVSLANDTNVNYKGTKKEHDVDVIMRKNPKLTQENATNVISSEPVGKLKEPKGQIEIIKNTTVPKILRVVDADDYNREIEKPKVTPLIAPELANSTGENIGTGEAAFEAQKIPKAENKTTIVENNGEEKKGRTISFGGINQFGSEEVKAVGTKKSAEFEFTKEARPPYPYVKSSTSNPVNSSKLGGSTEEISALENTIGRSPDDKKLVITEPSVVIDNSIQQIKPTYFKRSGNVSRMSNISTSEVPTTAKSPETTELPNVTYPTVPKNTANDIPRSHEVIEKKNSLDLTENGLTEVPEKNSTVPHESRATEANLVQNSTEIPSKSETIQPASTSIDIQTNAEDAMLMVSPLNITEDSTKLPTTTFKPNPAESTLNPPIFSPSTTVTDETLATTVEEVSTTSLPEAVSSSSTSQTSKTELRNFTGRGIDSESTTSGVEYEFIGLTETTASPTYVSSSDAGNTSATELPLETSLGASTTNLSSIIPETTDTPRENSTQPVKTDDLTTTDVPLDSITTTESVQFDTTIYTTSSIDTSYTDITTIIPDDTTYPEFRSSNESRFDTSRSVDSTNSTISTVMTNTEISPSNATNALSTGPPSTTTTSVTFEVDTPTTGDSTGATNTESTIQVVTDVQPFAPEDVNLLVRIVVEGTWSDVCPHLPALRQSLADLLTAGIEKVVLASQIVYQKNPCMDKMELAATPNELSLLHVYLYVVDQSGNFDAPMTRILPSLYSRASIKSQLTIRTFQLVQDSDSGNAIAVVVVSCVAFICLVLLAGLLFIMRKRQTRFNYGERCRPVSLDAFSLDSVSAYNSVRRKGANRSSKRSYGNPTFEDSTAIPSHPLNFAGLSGFCNEQNTIYEEFSSIPQVSARIDELPPGAEVKNRYANVVPLPETRVPLSKINNDPLSEYINASYVRGPKNATKYYIACQAPIESTVTDFWRMIWEQQSKVIIMLTDLVENGVEKCAEYIPPSEVTDCHRLYGDFQVTLKKRETKEKYAISTLHLKNLENNTYREISHIWYLWPANGVQTDAAGLIGVLLEARALQRGGPGPIVVHCSPGTGRTGTLIALDLGIRQYEITRTVDVPRVVYTIRRDRAGAVQTKEQYAFIYKALNLYATKLAGGGLEST